MDVSVIHKKNIFTDTFIFSELICQECIQILLCILTGLPKHYFKTDIQIYKLISGNLCVIFKH